MGVERLAIAGREDRHPVRLRLALILEERVEVALDHVPQNIHPEDASAIGQRASLREPEPAAVTAPLVLVRLVLAEIDRRMAQLSDEHGLPIR